MSIPALVSPAAIDLIPAIPPAGHIRVTQELAASALAVIVRRAQLGWTAESDGAGPTNWLGHVVGSHIGQKMVRPGEPVFIKVDADLLAHAQAMKKHWEEGSGEGGTQPLPSWIGEVLASEGDMNQQFTLPRAFIDEYVRLLDGHKLSPIETLSRKVSVKHLIEQAREKPAAGADANLQNLLRRFGDLLEGLDGAGISLPGALPVRLQKAQEAFSMFQHLLDEPAESA